MRSSAPALLAALPLLLATPAARGSGADPAAAPAATGAVRVTVLVTGSDGKAQPAEEAVAWLPGLSGAPRPTPPLRMASHGKRFEPRVLAVPKGATVTFPNMDKVFHNVFSLSEAGPFDLGLYRNGASRTATFPTPGVVRVYCNIHPQMAAYLVVLDTNLYAQTGKDGTARIDGVPPGRQLLKVWDEKGGEWSGTVVVPAGGTADVTAALDASKWRLQPHKNKHGRDYLPPDEDENRY